MQYKQNQIKYKVLKFNGIFKNNSTITLSYLQRIQKLQQKIQVTQKVSMMWKEKLTPQNIKQQIRKIDKFQYQNNVHSIEEKPNEEEKQYSLDMEFKTEESSFNRSKSLGNRSKKSKSTESESANKIQINIKKIKPEKIQDSPQNKKKHKKIKPLEIPNISLNLGKVSKSSKQLNLSSRQTDKSASKIELKRNKTPQNKVQFFFSNNLLAKSLNLSDIKSNKKKSNKRQKSKRKLQEKSDQQKIKLNLPKELLLDSSYLNSARSRQHKKKTHQ